MDTLISIHCHMFMVVNNNNGFGLVDWIYERLILQSLLITDNLQ
jgi:hypothetical protein